MTDVASPVPKELLRFAEVVPNETYAFDAFTLDVTERRLARGRDAIPLEPKTFDVLTSLVRQHGRLLTKRQILDEVWPDAFVDEGILSVHVARLRTALGRSGSVGHIETVARSGYRFTTPVATYAGVGQAVGRGPSEGHSQIHGLVGRGRARVLSASYFEVPKAVTAFEEAIAADPTYAAGHAGLALARCAQAGLRLLPHAEAFAMARASALRALALDDRSADAHAAMGAVLLMNDWDWVAAGRAIERALSINTSHTEAYVLHGRLLDALGHASRALARKMKALERDPDSPFVHLEIALSYWHQREYEHVLEWAGRTLELDPRHLFAREMTAGAHWKLRDFDRHLAESIDHARTFGVPEEALAPLRQAYDRDGRRGVVAYSIEHVSRTPPPALHVQLSILYAESGDLGRAFEHLDAAIAIHDPALIYLAVAPQWDDLRPDTRLDTRLLRLGLKPERA
jgi:DNA-binding winged helix-turn-helix (wHTH) protein/tetratricopeptide (TPR) repeat protein